MTVASLITLPLSSWRARLAGAGLVTALHAAALWALLQTEAARHTAAEPTPLFVSFVTREDVQPVVPETPPQPAPRPKKTQPPPPKSKPKKTEPPLIVTEAAAPSPAPVEAPVTPESPAPIEPVMAAQAEPITAPAVEPVEPPRFDLTYLDNPPPDYPRLSRRLGEQGKVILRVLVNAEGRAEQVEVHASSGHPRLDRAAVAAVRAWRFVPARRGAAAVAGWAQVPVNFVFEK